MIFTPLFKHPNVDPHFDPLTMPLSAHLTAHLTAHWRVGRSRCGARALASGSELASMPLEAMELFAELCPAAWQMARQAHLPKAKGLKASDGAREVSGLRPLTLFSSWYRLWASARLRTTDAQAWQDTWWPAEALGDKKGKELFEALAPLFQEATKHRYLISLDFSLAFDYCDPLVASFVLEKFGLPAPLGRMLLQQ